MCAQGKRLAGRILLAMDNPEVQQTVGFVAARCGHELIQATTGIDAINLTASLQPDLVVLHTLLRDVTWRDVLARLKADARSSLVPIVVWSGGLKESEDERKLALELGAEDYLEMINAQLLLRRLERVLRRFNHDAR